MERVSEDEVLAHWLSVETDASSGEELDPGGSSTVAESDTAELLDALLRLEPAAYVLWEAQPISWVHLTLSGVELDRLRVVEGPSGMGWRALAPDDTIASAAMRIEGETDPPDVRGVDVDRIRTMADDLEADGSVADLVLVRRGGCTPPYVVDGNHRATAVSLGLRRTGEYEPVGAYLGIATVPVLDPLWQRICATLSKLRARRGGPRW